MSNSFIKSYWKPLTAVIVWGFSFVATKYALDEITPLTIIFLRQLLGIAFLGFIIIKQKKSFKITRQNFFWIILLGLVTSLHLFIQVTGLQWTTASNTGWIIGVTPVFMIILSAIFFKERITLMQLGGILVAFAGLILLVSKGDITKIDLIKNKGDVLVITSSFTWAVYSIISKKATLDFSPLLATFYLFAIMAIVTAPFNFCPGVINAVIHLSLGRWLAIIFLGILCSGVGYMFWAQSLNEMSASRAGAFLYFEPFIAFFSSVILLDEKATILTFLSGIIIIAGVILVNRK